MCSFKFCKCALDSLLLLCGNLVAVLFELFLGRENHTVSTIDFVHTLALLFVLSLVSLSLVAHTLNLCIGQAARSLDTNALLLACAFVFRRHTEDAVCVDVERNLNLGYATGSCGDTVEVEATDSLVVACHLTLALQNVNLYLGLVVLSGREHLTLANGNGGVGVNEASEYATEGLNTEREGSYIEEKHIFNLASEYATLNCSTDSYNLIGVYTLRGSFAKEVLNNLLDCGDTGRTTHEDNLVNLVSRETCIAKCFAARLDGCADKAICQLLEFSASKGSYKVLGNTIYGHNVGEVNLCRGAARKLDFSLLCCLFQTLHSHRVFAEVDAVFALEVSSQPVDNNVVEVVTAEVGIAIGRFNLKHTVAKLQNRDIEGTTTKVVHSNLHILASLVKTVCQSSSSRLVDNTANFKTCNLASLFGCLTLRVAKICGNGNNCLRNGGTEVILCGLFHLLENDSRNLLGGVFTAANLNHRNIVSTCHYIVGYAGYIFCHLAHLLAHKAFDGEDGVFGVGDSLTLCGVAHFTLAALGESHNRRGCAVTLAVGDNYGLVALHNCYTRVGCTQVNTNNLCHNLKNLVVYTYLLY